jgi:hypothetical protein
MNEDALARWGLSRQKQIIYHLNTICFSIGFLAYAHEHY